MRVIESRERPKNASKSPGNTRKNYGVLVQNTVYDVLAFDILAPDILALTFRLLTPWHLGHFGFGRFGTRDILAPVDLAMHIWAQEILAPGVLAQHIWAQDILAPRTFWHWSVGHRICEGAALIRV